MEERLRPYGCRRVQSSPTGLEFWVTGWGAVFTMTPEGPDARYDEWLFFHVLATVIAKTMPSGWDLSVEATGNVKKIKI